MSARRWPRKARWFLAEFMVVLTGVLVALALNAWWSERQNRQMERVYLLQLHEDLTASETDLSAIADEMMTRALHSAAVGHAFWDPSSASAEELMVSLLTPLSSMRARPILGTAQALVATGDLGLIRSDRLRSELMSYLEWSQARIENIARFDETYYRPGVALIGQRFDPTALRRMVDSATGSPLLRGTLALSMSPATDGAPFPLELSSILRDVDVYRGYSDLLVGHRNQAFEYERMTARSRYLRNLVHQELHGVPDPGNCQLEPVADGFSGSCGSALPGPGRAPLLLQLRQVEAPVTGRWKTDGRPTRSWAGRALLIDAPSDVEIEVDIRGHGVIRTVFGWFEVRDLLADGPQGLSFRITGDQEVAGSDLDAGILRRARELLDYDATWDREDDRSCERTDDVMSLYCALRQATMDVTGGFHHRRPALQIVRRIVEERSIGRDYEHRLRDYNNDPHTSLADIHSLLEEALATLMVNRP